MSIQVIESTHTSKYSNAHQFLQLFLAPLVSQQDFPLRYLIEADLANLRNRHKTLQPCPIGMHAIYVLKEDHEYLSIVLVKMNCRTCPAFIIYVAFDEYRSIQWCAEIERRKRF